MQALSIDAAFLRSLRERPVRGCVHSVFRRVVNVEREDGGLFTIASGDLDDAPNTLLADAAGFDAAGIARGDRVAADARGIAIGERLFIRVDGSRGWDASLPAYPRDDARLRRNLGILRSQPAPAPAAGGFAARVAAVLAQRAAMLCAALRREDRQAAATYARAMLGLGPGLTPSGDDFLVGLFAVLHLPGSPCHRWRSICADVVARLEGHTNAISAAALQMAAGGRVRASVHTLIGALLHGSPAELRAALAQVLKIGSTSGADMVAGIVAGLEVNLAARGDRS